VALRSTLRQLLWLFADGTTIARRAPYSDRGTEALTGLNHSDKLSSSGLQWPSGVAVPDNAGSIHLAFEVIRLETKRHRRSTDQVPVDGAEGVELR
jgi:hypothetical protein